MSKFVLASAALLLSIIGALAQSPPSPAFSYKYIPTPGQWNSYFQAKQDYLGYTPFSNAGGALSGPLTTTASTAAAAGFTIPPGAPPNTPINGNMWLTSSGLYAYINGATVGPFAPSSSSAFVATAPLAVVVASGVVTYSMTNGTSVANPGTGTPESLLPNQTITGTSHTYATADLFYRTRRSNSGSAMTDTFPASSATGLVNGTRIVVANVDTTASITITAGAGTTIDTACSVVAPARDEYLVYDASTTTWRGVADTCGVPTGTGAVVLATGPTLTNPVVGTQTAGDNSTKAASTAYVATAISNAASGSSIGFVNKFRNGTMDVWQRGTSALATSTSGAYTADGWIVKQTGAAFTVSRDTGTAGTLYSLRAVGGTSNTDTTIAQRIESYMAAPLAGAVVTVQFQFKQDTGSAVTPKLSTCYAASAQDNFTTCTSDLAAVSLTSCASGSWCTEAYVFTTNASASQGYQVTLDCNTALTSAQHCWATAADIRITPGLSTGINAAPPTPELHYVGSELALCQRYYWQSSAIASEGYASGFSDSSTSAQFLIPFPTIMRAAPTLSYSAANTFAVRQGGGSITASSGPTSGTTSPRSASGIIVGVSSGLTTGGALRLQDAGSANSFIAASAEL
jgi:hypothetical protein